MSFIKAFRELINTDTGNEWFAWLEEANHSVIAELKSFAIGLLFDLQSIENPCNLHSCDGPIEGNFIKLKTIKPQIYGRTASIYSEKDWC